jgi:hypothetical protein
LQRRGLGLDDSAEHPRAAHAQLGNPRGALTWLRTAADSGFPCYPWFARDPLLDPLRQDAAFAQFMSGLRRAHEAARRQYAAK